MYKGVIFDLDGVICHTDKYHFLAWDKICTENNLKFSYDINHKLRGVSRLDSLNIILKENNIELDENKKEILSKLKNEYYLELLNSMTKDELDKDVLNLLKTLKSKNIKLAIGSSSKNAKIILNKLSILDMFDCVVDGNDIIHSKPNPEVFIKAQKCLGLEKKECIIVEDAVSGINAGIKANIDTVSYNIHEENNSKYQIENILELLKII